MESDSTRGPVVPRVSISGRTLVVLVFGGLAATTNAQVFALLLAPIARDLGYSVAKLGGLRTTEEVAAVATAIALTPVVDRYPRKWLLVAGFVLMATAAALISMSFTVWMLIGFFVIDGVSKILLFSALLALPSDLSSGREHDRALGFVIGSFSIAGVTAVPLAGVLSDAFTWRAGYVLAVALAGVAIMSVAVGVPSVQPPPHRHESLRAHASSLSRLPGFAIALAGAFCRFAMFASVLNYGGAYLIDERGVSVGRAGFYFSLGAFAFLAASILSGYVLVLVGVSRVLLGAGLATGVLALTAFGSGQSLAVVGACLLGTVALMGMLENASTGLLLRLAPDDRGAAMSLNELVAAAGSLLGIGVCAVVLRSSGFGGVAVFLAALAVIGAVVSRRALSPHLSLAVER